MLDGMPESFIGPLLADLVSHEVGHTLGLRHNFKASSVYKLAEMNSEELKGKKPFAGSVMDYLPTNFKVERGEIQGDYAMIGVGPYDMWAIEYGYTFDDKKLKKILVTRCRTGIGVLHRRRHFWSRSVGSSLRLQPRSRLILPKTKWRWHSIIVARSWKNLSKTVTLGKRLVKAT